MKTLADFKKVVQVGAKLQTIYHRNFIGRTEDGTPIYGDRDMGVREVSIKQTTQFAMKTIKNDGTITDSWMQFGKASDCKVNDKSITLYCDGEKLLTYIQID